MFVFQNEFLLQVINLAAGGSKFAHLSAPNTHKYQKLKFHLAHFHKKLDQAVLTCPDIALLIKADLYCKCRSQWNLEDCVIFCYWHS